METFRHNTLVLLFFFFCLLFDPIRAQISATVSIYSGPDYVTQRPCAKGCFQCPGVWSDYDCFANNFGCGEHNVLNQCFCRADLQPAAYSILSKCVSSACSYTIDVQSALSIYTGYCATMASTLVIPSITSSSSAAIATVAVASGTAQVVSVVTVTSTPVETTIIYKNSASGNDIPSISVLTTSTVRAISTDNANPSTTIPSHISLPSELKGSSSLSVSDRISLGVGISIPLLAIIVSIIICRYQMERRTNREQTSLDLQ